MEVVHKTRLKAERSHVSPLGHMWPQGQRLLGLIVVIMLSFVGRVEASSLASLPGTHMAHSFDGFDCERPTTVTRSQLPTKCEEIVKTKGQHDLLLKYNFTDKE